VLWVELLWNRAILLEFFAYRCQFAYRCPLREGPSVGATLRILEIAGQRKGHGT
jgi:hypothetical protein